MADCDHWIPIIIKQVDAELREVVREFEEVLGVKLMERKDESTTCNDSDSVDVYRDGRG